MFSSLIPAIPMIRGALATTLLLLGSSSHAITIEFTAAEGYANGNLKDQNGWARSYGTDPVCNVDVSGTGNLVPIDLAGAVYRQFSDGEAGAAFDANASTVSYTFVVTYNSLSSGANGFLIGIGEGYFNAANLDVGLRFKADGTIGIRDGVLSGGAENLGGATPIPIGTPVTISLELDYANSTYTISRSDTGATRTSYPFVKGTNSQGGHFLRIDSNVTLVDLELDTITMSSQVPVVGTADYYVATDGDDNNPGTLADPFLTIQKAADVMQAGDSCIIRGGTYRETITPANSGTAGNPIIYKAAAGETVVITGLDPISGWTQHSGDIYKTGLTWTLDHEDQVFVVDGLVVTCLWEARWPNITDYSFDGLRNGFALADGGSPSTLVDDALNQANDYWNGATVWYIGGKGGWLGKTSVISDFDGGTGTLTLADVDSTGQDPYSGSEYYLSGILDELDSEHEWFIDATTQEIYLWAPGGGVPANIEVKKRLEGMVLQNKSYINVEGIEFLAANIQLDNSDYCKIDGINARYIYGSDKSLGYGASNQRAGGINVVGDYNTIQNSELSYTTGSMIQLNGTGNQVVNNHIHHTTMLGNYASAIQIDTGDSHLISHNTIHEVGRCAISSTNSFSKLIFQNNHIYNYMWLSADGAAIYFWGMDMGNSEIRYNIIHDGQGVTNGHGITEGHAIYMDSQASYVLIHHNVVYDAGDSTAEALRFNRPAVYRLVYNNTFMDNPGGSFDWHWNSRYFGDLFGSVMLNNILTDNVDLQEDLLYENNITSDVGLNLVDRANRDYRLDTGSTAIDVGEVYETITNGYVGSLPDIGAYEFGATGWTAGHNFLTPPTPDFARSTSKHMNLLTNAGFDRLNDWSSSTGAQIRAIPPASLLRGARNYLRISGSSGEGVEQTVTGLKPDTIYRLSGWVFCDAGEEIEFGVKDYGGSAMNQTATNALYDERRDIFFATGATDTEASVFITKTSSGLGYVYADDFGLVEIGENLVSDLPIQSDLLLHLDASKITDLNNGDPVWNWQNLAASGTAATAENSGTTPAFTTSALNGKPVVRFDGNNDWLDIGTLRAGEDSVEIFLVVQSADTNGSNWQRFISAFTSGDNDWEAPNWLVMRPNSGGEPLTVVPSIVTQSYSSGRHIDGIDLARNAQATSQYFEGDIAEVVIYGRNLNDAEKNQINYHLAHKYGFDVSSYVDTTTDSDGDGWSDLDELIAGTLINEPNDFFSSQVSIVGGEFEKRWDSVVDREYTVKRSFNLVDWEDIETFFGDDLEKSFSDSIDTSLNPSAYYLIEITHH